MWDARNYIKHNVQNKIPHSNKRIILKRCHIYSFFNNLNSLYLLIKIWIIWNFSFNDLLLLLVEQFLSQLTYTVLITFFGLRVLFYSASIMHKCNTTPYINYVKLAVTMKGFRVLTCFYKISSLWHF